MVAYGRDRTAIGESVNADGVAFLSLEDLEVACAELSPRPNQQFEVGVFCGRYVTPLPPGYLEHLEKTRGGKRNAVESEHSRGFVTVGDSITCRPTVIERSDVSLHNVADNQL